MAGSSFDLWGCMFLVFLIVAVMVMVIKILLEFPGLLSWKCVYEDRTQAYDLPPLRPLDIERGRLHVREARSQPSLHTVRQGSTRSRVTLDPGSPKGSRLRDTAVVVVELQGGDRSLVCRPVLGEIQMETGHGSEGEISHAEEGNTLTRISSNHTLSRQC